MKPLAFNLRDAKKVAGDQHTSTFMVKGGHQIRVAHSALRPEHQEAIKKLPIYRADGGPTNEDLGVKPEWQPAAAAAPQPINMGTEIGNALRGVGQYLMTPAGQTPQYTQPDVQVTSEDVPEEQSPAPQATPSAPAPATPQMVGNLEGGYNSYLQGLKGQQGVDTALARAERTHAQEDLQAKQDLMTGLQQNLADFKEQHNKFVQDIQNNQINPRHYQESQSAGQKVATAIGLFLGGWSSAYTHQGNPAMNFLQAQIDRDIQAQRANQENRKTLLSANQAYFHDEMMANNATRIQLNDIYLDKMRVAAAEQGTPQALAKYQMARGAFEMQNAQLLQQNALRATVFHSMSSGDMQHMDPTQQIRLQEMSGLMAPPEAKAATEAVGKIDAVENLRRAVEENARDLGSKTFAGKLEPSYRAAKINNLSGVLAKLAEGRFNLEESKQQMDAMMPGALDRAETREAQASGRKQFFDSLRAEHEAALRKFNISIPQSINQNPMKTMNGVQYQKVQGGWQRVK